MFVVFVIVRAGRVVNVIPVRYSDLRITILLPLLSPTTLPSLPSIESVDIIVVGR